MSDRERINQLQAEVERLKSEQSRKDDERWDLVKEQYSKCEQNWREVHSKLNQVHKEVAEINVTVNGTAEAPEKGLKIRLDRIEQKEKSRSWFNRAVGGTLLTLVLKQLWSLLSGKP